MLTALYPGQEIIHDYPLGGGLKLDFLIRSSVNVGIEVDGRQHYEPCSRYHSEPYSLDDQKRRDAKKEEVCREKGIALARIRDTELSSEALHCAIVKAINNAPKSPTRSTPKNARRTEYNNNAKEFARKVRKENYQRYKKWKKGQSDGH